MRFLIAEKDIEGTNGEQRIKEVLAMGKEATQTYKVDQKRIGVANTQGKRYDAILLAEVSEILKEMAYFFGYAKGVEENNSTDFLEFAKPEPELVKTFKGYKAMNKSMIEWICTMKEHEAAQIRYQLSDKTKEVDLMSFESAEFATRANRNWCERALYKQAFS